jgi:hypothetical protein
MPGPPAPAICVVTIPSITFVRSPPAHAANAPLSAAAAISFRVRGPEPSPNRNRTKPWSIGPGCFFRVMLRSSGSLTRPTACISITPCCAR